MPSTATLSGSDQPENRSLGGILVHVLALFTSFVGPAIMYAVSDHEFTRENARNAINWHITVIVLAVAAFVTGFLGADEVTINGEPTELLAVPSPLDTVFTFIGIPLLLALVVAVFATFGFAVVATQKAASGSAWSYPGSINIIERFR
ncbi:DUF4870 family protein [Natrialba magadii ATCC 43099]|uniref:Acyltransferase n=1 Tax=Natrialba magadii (strain ATCC 43099 / DSM 3394 / CCM 3739 / CIP 104546 / IAM 13178 / JCM 8861 / NBRC 102185 / NCIMB 2190 / MS3) TaxID=547559 RepID=D3SS44_NATMM|nr:DUF4870 domain-containing protein [Natrialba magadii]ADD04380.1 DUF4870 family protein [Natrialba magadii ATCC 43099]ADD04770.1 DUF4870 family protein [Natrialba magadii ATCC 43099]ELY24937.1 acyltransferase [Natrialba magadii ATCC 43099]